MNERQKVVELHSTSKTVATAKVIGDFVEVEYINRACSWCMVSWVYADGREVSRTRINSQRSRLPAMLNAAARKLLAA